MKNILRILEVLNAITGPDPVNFKLPRRQRRVRIRFSLEYKLGLAKKSDAK